MKILDGLLLNKIVEILISVNLLGSLICILMNLLLDLKLFAMLLMMLDFLLQLYNGELGMLNLMPLLIFINFFNIIIL